MPQVVPERRVLTRRQASTKCQQNEIVKATCAGWPSNGFPTPLQRMWFAPGKLMEWHDPLADHSGVEDVVSSLELAGLLEKRSIEDVIVISCDATSSIYIYI